MGSNSRHTLKSRHPVVTKICLDLVSSAGKSVQHPLIRHLLRLILSHRFVHVRILFFMIIMLFYEDQESYGRFAKGPHEDFICIKDLQCPNVRADSILLDMVLWRRLVKGRPFSAVNVNTTNYLAHIIFHLHNKFAFCWLWVYPLNSIVAMIGFCAGFRAIQAPIQTRM
ncbi:hypothetical protein ACLOJK_016571 [Asimina triloba]